MIIIQATSLEHAIGVCIFVKFSQHGVLSAMSMKLLKK